MSGVVIFLGPTLPEEEARQVLDATYLGPVSQGDVFRAAQREPRAMGIIDGYFQRVPSVWHKEILYAMSRGIHVFGASSMGALRAAELETFGMVGVGRIFAAFRDGELQDDDEVTIAHAAKEAGYRLLSQAMVNIRFTLEQAQAGQVISAETRARLVELAKARYYPERGYKALLADAAGAGLPAGEITALEAWLPGGAVDQKREDALEMLGAMDKMLQADPGPKQVTFSFQHTDVWDQVAKRTGRQLGAALPEELPADTLLDELRLQGDKLQQALGGAMTRGLALREARRQGVKVGQDQLRQAMGFFCAQRALLRPAQVQAWMAEQGLDDRELMDFIQDEARVSWVSTMAAGETMKRLVDHLRATGDFGRLAARAEAKRRLLEERGQENPDLESVGVEAGELMTWFFEERRGQELPADLDHYANIQGFPDRHALVQAVLREYLFVEISEKP